MTNKLLFFVLLALCFSGCDMLETHPYDVHITGERELTNKNIQLIENKMQGKKTIRFAMISDTQRWYNSTEDVVKALNARGDIDFVIHGETSPISASQKNSYGCGTYLTNSRCPTYAF